MKWIRAAMMIAAGRVKRNAAITRYSLSALRNEEHERSIGAGNVNVKCSTDGRALFIRGVEPRESRVESLGLVGQGLHLRGLAPGLEYLIRFS
jgi:hypothetical protein